MVDDRCLELIVCFVDIGGIAKHHCLDVIVRFVDIGVNYQPSLSKLSFLNFRAISTPTL